MQKRRKENAVSWFPFFGLGDESLSTLQFLFVIAVHIALGEPFLIAFSLALLSSESPWTGLSYINHTIFIASVQAPLGSSPRCSTRKLSTRLINSFNSSSLKEELRSSVLVSIS